MNLLALSLLFSASYRLVFAEFDLNACVSGDNDLRWLSTRRSEKATMVCSEAESTDRYWAALYVPHATVVVFPANSQNVSYAVKATSKTPLGNDFAFASGGHSMTGASSSNRFVIDLKFPNRTTVLHTFTDPITGFGTAVVMYEGGVTSLGLQMATNGTGWTALSARVRAAGMGGFSTGGGIGFMPTLTAMQSIGS